jgi:hypothetical protein
MKDSNMFLLLREYKKHILFFVCACFVLCGLLLLNSADFRKITSDRQVLSSVQFELKSFPNELFQVLKIRERNNIVVEAYSISGNREYTLLSRIDTHNKYDGFFLLGGNATNLAYLGAGRDSDAQILIPGFDQNLVAYLNVIRFDPTSKSFTLLTNLPTIQ